MKPAWTDADLPTTPPVSLAQVREWVGIFDDTSMDASVTAALSAAVEKVSAQVGFRIADTNVRDFYDGNDGIFELSAPGIDPATVAVAWYDVDGNMQTADAADWMLDPTSPENAIHWTGPERETSDRFRHPWRVAYTSRLADALGPDVASRIDLALRLVVNHYFFNRGRPDVENAGSLERDLFTLLKAVRKDGGLTT